MGKEEEGRRRRKHLNVISVTVLSVYVRFCPFLSAF